jgi:hypothetical protein
LPAEDFDPKGSKHHAGQSGCCKEYECFFEGGLSVLERSLFLFFIKQKPAFQNNFIEIPPPKAIYRRFYLQTRIDDFGHLVLPVFELTPLFFSPTEKDGISWLPVGKE